MTFYASKKKANNHMLNMSVVYVTMKKATKRRQLLEKHTPGWTPKDEEHPNEGPSSRKPVSRKHQVRTKTEHG